MSMKSLFNFNVHMQQFVPILDGLPVSQEIKTPQFLFSGELGLPILILPVN